MTELRKCKNCKLELPISCFYSQKKGVDKTCRNCRNEQRKARQRAKALPQLCACGCGNLTTGLINSHSGELSRFINGHHSRTDESKKAVRRGQIQGKELGHYKKSDQWRESASRLKLGTKNPMYGNVSHMRRIASQPGVLNPNYGKPPPQGNIYPFLDRKGRAYKFRSTWELKFAQWLDMQGLNWDYEPRRFNLGDRTYCPDFWIEEFSCFWEIKGWFHERHQQTISLFRQLYPDQPLVVATKSILESCIGKLR